MTHQDPTQQPNKLSRSWLEKAQLGWQALCAFVVSIVHVIALLYLLSLIVALLLAGVCYLFGGDATGYMFIQYVGRSIGVGVIFGLFKMLYDYSKRI